jgi:hypothetical protein
MNDEKLRILYSGYYDAPLSFIVNYREVTYYFWRGYFDDDIDDFPSEYEVFRLERTFSRRMRMLE